MGRCGEGDPSDKIRELDQPMVFVLWKFCVSFFPVFQPKPSGGFLRPAVLSRCFLSGCPCAPCLCVMP